MKRKIITITVWVLLTFLYCWNFWDVGSSIGKRINSTVETYAEMVAENGGTSVKLEDSGKAISDAWSYGHYYNLGERFSGNFLFLSITTVIYFAISVLCYHFTFIKDNI